MKRFFEIGWKILNHRGFLVFSIILFTALYGTIADRDFGWTKQHPDDRTPIISDGAGYYAWLPEWFLYEGKESHFRFLETIKEKYPDQGFHNNILSLERKPFNKYFTGSALAMAPFFAVGHWLAGIYDVPQDGYSWPYTMMAGFSLIFYFMLGCVALSYLLRAFHIDRFWIVITLLLLAFGTNIGFYVYGYIPYSHVFSFTFCTWFLYFAKRWAGSPASRAFIWMCVFLGLLVITRPTNAIVVLIVPFFFPSFRLFAEEGLKNGIVKQWKILLAGMILFSVIVFFQLASSHWQTGSWSLNTYDREGFDNWNRPKVYDVLFSWRKGLFVYAPALLLVFPGLFVLYRKNRQLFRGTALTLAVFTYVTASWWCWWYGGGLGMRPYIDMYALMLIPVAFLLQHSRNWIKLMLIGLIVIGCKLGITYDAQLRVNILHYDEMNREKFFRVFMHREERYAWAAHLDYDSIPSGTRKITGRHYFDIENKRMATGQLYKVITIDSLFIPHCSIVSDSSQLPFAGLLAFDILLNNDASNPSFRLRYYKDGLVLKETKLYAGSFIPEINKLTQHTFEIYPDLKMSGFDSVYIDFDKNAGEPSLRNVVFKQLEISK